MEKHWEIHKSPRVLDLDIVLVMLAIYYELTGEKGNRSCRVQLACLHVTCMHQRREFDKYRLL